MPIEAGASCACIHHPTWPLSKCRWLDPSQNTPPSLYSTDGSTKYTSQAWRVNSESVDDIMMKLARVTVCTQPVQAGNDITCACLRPRQQCCTLKCKATIQDPARNVSCTWNNKLIESACWQHKVRTSQHGDSHTVMTSEPLGALAQPAINGNHPTTLLTVHCAAASGHVKPATQWQRRRPGHSVLLR
jgi:hypothetical protein